MSFFLGGGGGGEVRLALLHYLDVTIVALNSLQDANRHDKTQLASEHK